MIHWNGIAPGSDGNSIGYFPSKFNHEVLDASNAATQAGEIKFRGKNWHGSCLGGLKDPRRAEGYSTAAFSWLRYVKNFSAGLPGLGQADQASITILE